MFALLAVGFRVELEIGPGYHRFNLCPVPASTPTIALNLLLVVGIVRVTDHGVEGRQIFVRLRVELLFGGQAGFTDGTDEVVRLQYVV